MTQNQSLLSAAEVAAMFRTSEGAVNRAVRSGEFPQPLRIAGQRRWPMAMIERHVEQLSNMQPREETK